MSLASASTIPGYVLRYRSHAMDGVYSIVAGLLLRVVVDAATFHNVKLSGTLVGLWEGVVLLHYVNKAPSSTDPYLAYGVRLFVDFLVTESIFKLMIVLLWSTMGMVLADVAPGVWNDTGLKRQWSRLRHDLSRSARMFSKRRTTTVRFVSSPTIATTIVSTASSVGSTVTATTTFPSSTTAPPESPTTPTTSVVPSVSPVHPPITIRRKSLVPGTFPGAEWSETDTDAGTVVEEGEDEDQDAAVPPRPSHITISRIVPRSEYSYTNSFTTSPRSSSPAYSLEYSDDPSAYNPVDIPSEVEDELEVRIHRRRTDSDRETTPKQMVVVLPPTPSESLNDWGSVSSDEDAHGAEDVHGVEDVHEDVPPSPGMPVIPDHEPLDEWETVNAEEEAADRTTSTSTHEEENDDASVAAPSTIAPDPVPDHPPAPIDEPADDPNAGSPISMPIPDPAPPPAEEETHEFPPTQDPPVEPENAPAPDPQHPPQLGENANRTPPPSFEDLYGSDARLHPPAGSDLDPTTIPIPPSERAASRPTTPIPSPSPIPSIRRALSLRKEALEITARIAALARQRKTSISEGNQAAAAAAILTKIEMDRAEKELAVLNAKAEGAFVGAYNPPTASLYELNTTGLTGEEAVRQTEMRLEKLLLAPVPPAGTRPEDLIHDSPNRGVLKVTMEQSIKGRMVKQKLLAALNDNGIRWNDDVSRPNVIFVMLPVTAEEPASATDESAQEKAEEDDAREY